MSAIDDWRDYLTRDNRGLGHPPATAAAVTAAERRLAVRFPPSLRGFLLTSNGWAGVRHVDAVYSCDRIDWFRDTGHGRAAIDAYLDFYGEPDGEDDEGDPYPITVFERALVVAGGVDHWLLDPVRPGPDGEWTAWQYQGGQGKLVRFASFAALFRAEDPG